MSDWDAASYHRVSDPQWAWGVRVLDRLAPQAAERILDIGCGTARLTEAIRRRAGHARVAAIDRSWSMLTEAMRGSGAGIPLVQADAVRLPFATGFDAVFSTATFHWIADHQTLFAEIHRVLRRGGRLIAQTGGGPNLARLYGRAAALASEPEYRASFHGWRNPWTFAGVEETRERLSAAGFTEVHVWLESIPTTFPDAVRYSEFVTTVCLRHHLARLPAESRGRYVDQLIALAQQDDPPLTLDYWRLNIDARA